MSKAVEKGMKHYVKCFNCKSINDVTPIGIRVRQKTLKEAKEKFKKILDSANNQYGCSYQIRFIEALKQKLEEIK